MLRKFGLDDSAPDQWSNTKAIRRHNEVWAGRRAGARGVIESNTYIKLSTVGRHNTTVK